MSGVLSLVAGTGSGTATGVWRVAAALGVTLALGGAFGVGALRGYEKGSAAARAHGEAALAELRGAYDRRYAEAMDAMNERLRQQAGDAMAAGAELAKEKERYAKQQADLLAKIETLARGGTYRFSPAFVGLWNEAVGAACSDASPAVSRAAGTAGTPGTRPPVDTGVQAVGPGGQDKSGGPGESGGIHAAAQVSEEDILNYIVYFGNRCREMGARLNALVTLIEGHNDVR